MKIGFNLLVLGGLITDAHASQLQRLAALGYDGVEIPILDGDAVTTASWHRAVPTWVSSGPRPPLCSAPTIPAAPMLRSAGLPTIACAG
jgi:hypothetical protein